MTPHAANFPIFSLTLDSEFVDDVKTIHYCGAHLSGV
jgi:hypothetical protein